jgi:hypothetical protein
MSFLFINSFDIAVLTPKGKVRRHKKTFLSSEWKVHDACNILQRTLPP